MHSLFVWLAYGTIFKLLAFLSTPTQTLIYNVHRHLSHRTLLLLPVFFLEERLLRSTHYCLSLSATPVVLVA